MAGVAKKHGISDVTIYVWCKRVQELMAVDVKWVRRLELAKATLKNLVAKRDLEVDLTLTEILICSPFM